MVTRRMFLASVGAGLTMPSLSVPADAAVSSVTLQASAAQTGAGSGTVIMDVSTCQRITVAVVVTAGSGTVNPFIVGIQGTVDGGTTWSELASLMATKQGGASQQPHTVNEVAVVTSGTYSGHYEPAVNQVRAYWNIAGTTPSETFSVIASCR